MSLRVKPLAFKLIVLIPFLCFATVVAALYGAVHNQISYTVAPSYFHEFKFTQFGIVDALQNRLGAAWVGAQASWFMGLIIGVPIYLAALICIPKARFIKTLWQATLLVVGVTLSAGLLSLIYAGLTLSHDNLPTRIMGRDLSQPLRFARAGTMHNASYLGGIIGIAAGLGLVIITAIRARKSR